jgi:RNA polymerase sigma-70 factor (sigma-E family)
VGNARNDVTAEVRVSGRSARVSDFEQFFNESYRRTLGLAYAVTGDRGHAEDIVQEAFAATHRRWASLAMYDDPQAWVRRLVLNKAASRWKRIGREARALARLGSRPTVLPIDLPLRSAQFWSAVALLPTRQAAAVALFYIEDLSIVDVAHELGCSVGTVKTHLSRARQTLRTQLERTQEHGGET